MILRDRLIERDGPTGTKAWTSILRLALSSSLRELAGAVEIALSRGTLDPRAIELLLRQRGDIAETLDLTLHAVTPAHHAQVVDLSVYRIAALVEANA
jgi:hypothetical protein